jgi:diketogulonate reductase-like aldo/keto reductase
MLVYFCVGTKCGHFFVSHRSIIHVHGIYTVRNSKLSVELCSALQLDYVDLYLVHIPAHFKKDGLVKEIESRDVPPTEEEVWQIKRSIMRKPRSGDLIAFHKEKWEGMERCVELGLAKAIGVSNFSVERIEEMLPYAKIIPAVNQVCFFPSGHMLGNVSFRDILAGGPPSEHVSRGDMSCRICLRWRHSS